MMLLSAAQDPYSLAAIGTLLAALGLSATAGLRAYIPLLAVGLAGSADIMPLQDSFKDLASPTVIIILAVLVVAEFIIDKIPLVDHVSDAVHTIIRPVSGAIIMAGTGNSLSTLSPWVAAALGALLALVFHGAKATTRPAVSATTAGIGNPIVSLVEDVVVIAAVLLLIFAPIIGVLLLVLVVVVFARLFARIVRRFRRKNGNAAGGKGGAARITPAGVGGAASPVVSADKRSGRKSRRGSPPRQVAMPVAPPALPAAPIPIPAPMPMPMPMPMPQGRPMAVPGAPMAPAPVPVPVPAVTTPPSPNAPTVPATYQPPYPAAAPANNPVPGGLPPVIAPPMQTRPYPPQAPAQQPGNLYPPDATTLPGTP
jgi:hypothetical protein